MARATTNTLLSLDAYARIVGIAPPHFNGSSHETIWPVWGVCNSVWPQHTWQTIETITSREELAQTINDVEQDIKRVLGFSPSLTWEANERHYFPRRRDAFAWQRPLKTKWGKVEAGGRRGYTAIGLVDVIYSDEDGDGYNELATIVVTTDVTDKREIKVYVPGYGGIPEYELRQVKSIEIVSGTATITFDSWQLFTQEVLDAYPTVNGFQPTNLTEYNSYLDEVDVGREYNDTSQAAAVYRWEADCCSCGSSGCVACSMGQANGCLAVLEQEFGMVRGSIATYSEGDERWNIAPNDCCCTHPTEVALWYQAGETSAAYVAGRAHEPISDYWAKTIAWMATARLHKPLCGCGNVSLFFEEMRRDLARSDRNSSSLVDLKLLSNPFGTRVGEVRAWQRVSALANGQIMEAGVL